jgi:GntR family transcriptional regulator/MocR family aminotransferase
LNRNKPVSLVLDRTKSSTLQEQVYEGLKWQISKGELRSGEPVPSSRDLARDLGVSRNTVIAAYDRLLGEGYLESQQRSRVYVNATLCDTAFDGPAGRQSLDARTPRSQERLHQDDDSIVGPRAFRPCQPDVSLFPLAQWNRLRNRAIRRSGLGLLHYQSKFALGLTSLRRSIADYLQASRGVRCDWTQVAITTGSQQALYFLSQLILKRGDRVMIEDPGYTGARFAFERAGAKLKPLNVDANGVIPPKKVIPSKLIYLTPSRQFPTGACLPVARRLAMLEVAKSAGAWIIEDDYDSEFRYTRPPLPSLHSLDNAGRVLYLGSMSKVLYPSLRIGYVVLPQELVEPFESLRLVLEDHGPLVDQATLAEFIQCGGLYTHIRRCRKAYSQKLEVFMEAADRHRLPLNFPFTDGGMNLAGYFEDPTIDAAMASRKLEDEGLDCPSLDRYSLKEPSAALVFGFTAFDHKMIQKSVAKVATVLR